MAGASILIVDDNAANLKLARVLLAGEGYTVKTAVDAEDALAVLASFKPALILMDIQLPGVDGLELTRRLKRDPATSGIAIIALTAYAMKGDEEKARAAGCDGYITKPIDPDTLPAVIAAHLGHGLGLGLGLGLGSKR
jgi:two-component system, cell cycle response regulator DivK